MALSVRIRSVSAADTLHFVEQGMVGKDRPSQFGPVTPAATPDHIVADGEGEALMVEVSMEHGGHYSNLSGTASERHTPQVLRRAGPVFLTPTRSASWRRTGGTT